MTGSPLGLDGFQKYMWPRAFDESRLNIRKITRIGCNAKSKKKTETLTLDYSTDRTQWELLNEYQHDRPGFRWFSKIIVTLGFGWK